MAMSNNSQSITTLQQKSRQPSMDGDDTNVLPSTRNLDLELKNNDTAEFGQNKQSESENIGNILISATNKILTMRSKKETSILQNMNDSKHEEIREEEGKTPHLHEKSSTTRKEIDAQTDDKQTTNFNRTISKISNSKMMTSQSQQNFLRAEKMKLREQIQIKKELKELEKENEELNARIEEITSESIGWKHSMSKRIVELEDKFKYESKKRDEDYAKDIIRATKLSKEREKQLIQSINEEFEAQYEKKIESFKTVYQHKLKIQISKEFDEKYAKIVEEFEKKDEENYQKRQKQEIASKKK